MAIEYGSPTIDLARALYSFQGVRRRFNYKIKTDKLVLIDDYAHHPTEIKTTIEAARKGWPDKEIISVFQPHLYSRTKNLYKDFATSLLDSDKIILLDIYGAREDKIEGVSSSLIQDELINNGHKNCIIVKSENLIEQLKRIYQENQIIITMGAGDLWKKGEDIIKNLYE